MNNRIYQCPYFSNIPMYNRNLSKLYYQCLPCLKLPTPTTPIILKDYGPEMHSNLDQFIRIEQGQGLVQMGNKKDQLDFQASVRDDYAFIIPAGTWHNLRNTGSIPLKLYSIYAPPQHPFGTVHAIKEIAEEAEKHIH